MPSGWTLIRLLRLGAGCGVAAMIISSCGGEPGSATATDCEIVAELSEEFRAMDGRDQTGGDINARFAEKVRAAAHSVSGAQVRDELTTWAEGFSTLSQIQRTHSSSPVADERAQLMEAGEAIYGTADQLRSTCPNAWPSASG